jgi:inosine-uridine nucleoside N-ribohydrolase
MSRFFSLRPSLFALALIPTLLLVGTTNGTAQAAKRYVVVDQDASGPGGSDMASLLVFLQSRKVNLLGVTVVSGDSWRDVEVRHALRLLEIVGRTDVRVYPGAVFPLMRTPEETKLSDQLYGRVSYTGAYNEAHNGAWDATPDLPEGNPHTKPAEEDAAHFLVRMVHEHPHQVTIYAAGPLTNIALAQRLDPHFAELAEQLVLMGGSILPVTEAREWINRPRHEFNFWFDPEAASIVLNAHWSKITATTIDASIQTHLAEVLAALRNSNSTVARYLVQYTPHYTSSGYAWDELAAVTWLDPAITTGEREVYMDVNIAHGPGYGDVLIWSDNDKPALPHQRVHAQVKVDVERLNRDLIELFSAETPAASAR